MYWKKAEFFEYLSRFSSTPGTRDWDQAPVCTRTACVMDSFPWKRCKLESADRISRCAVITESFPGYLSSVEQMAARYDSSYSDSCQSSRSCSPSVETLSDDEGISPVLAKIEFCLLVVWERSSLPVAFLSSSFCCRNFPALVWGLWPVIPLGVALKKLSSLDSGKVHVRENMQTLPSGF